MSSLFSILFVYFDFLFFLRNGQIVILILINIDSFKEYTKFKKQLINLNTKVKSENGKILNEEEIKKQLNNEIDNYTNLCDIKVEAANECEYLIKHHIKKINVLIENFEQSLSASQAITGDQKSIQEKTPSTLIDENYFPISNSKKKSENFSVSEKNDKILKKKKASKRKIYDKDEMNSLNNEINNLSVNNFEGNFNNANDNIFEQELNEPLYCHCNQVSFGDMIKCDNPNCPKEWFHYECVKITIPPEKWFCSKICENKLKVRKK